MAIGRDDNWTRWVWMKWQLDQMAMDQMQLDELANGIGRGGNKPIIGIKETDFCLIFTVASFFSNIYQCCKHEEITELS
jgi:hypothetical protein